MDLTREDFDDLIEETIHRVVTRYDKDLISELKKFGYFVGVRLHHNNYDIQAFIGRYYDYGIGFLHSEDENIQGFVEDMKKALEEVDRQTLVKAVLAQNTDDIDRLADWEIK